MNLTLSILTVIAVLIIGYLIYKSKRINKIKNSSSSIGYTYNRSKYSNSSDYSSSYSSSDSCSSSDSSSSCSD
mgnify:FL=1